MKELSQQTEMEKASLLHQLFASGIGEVITYIDSTAIEMLNNPQSVKDEWGTQKLSAAGWLELAKKIKAIIEQNSYSLTRYPKRFSEQLFDGFTALFSVQCLKDYSRVAENKRLSFAIQLLFGE